ncbi:prepilin peptidase [Poriferisphaera sp. WC338]|uniref:prepilin peptidase n=1 Tax=Poriferisphaera sp. WC338 TaxID=3425129 RepID=UPI003D81AF14
MFECMLTLAETEIIVTGIDVVAVPNPALIWVWLVFMTVFGAIVGSFLNVVAYRLPEGKSVVSPPSSCPKCGHRLAWHDNVPVLGWIWLGGKCRYCKTKISVQYPLIEAFCAFLFGGLFWVYYMSGMRPGFEALGFEGTWPVYVVHVLMLAGLLAATLIDFRLYIIPIQIPWVVTLFALVGLPLAVLLGLPSGRWLSELYMEGLQFERVPEFAYMMGGQIVPVGREAIWGAGIGGTIGLAVAMGLMWLKVIPRSFMDWEEQLEKYEAEQAKLAKEKGGAAFKKDKLPGGGIGAEEIQEEIFMYPHPRREVLKELLFVMLPLVGVVVGWMMTRNQSGEAMFVSVTWYEVLVGVLFGYLVGGGLVWLIRIGGTLGFGKEAMGLGDVHLLGAIGAVLGAVDATLVFFVAPFLGIVAAMITIGVASIAKGKVRVIPYGPYLAAAAVVVMVFRLEILRFLDLAWQR